MIVRLDIRFWPGTESVGACGSEPGKAWALTIHSHP